MKYGRFNRQGVPPAAVVSDILRRAARVGVRTLDTAAAYGDSEAVLGAAMPGGAEFRIVTKTPPFRRQRIANSDAETLRTTFDSSCTKLRTDRVYGLLAHDSNDLLADGGDHLFEAMCDLQAQGRVGKIGASIYARRQIEDLLERYRLDLIQLPASVLDQRLIDGGMLRELASRGIEIHLRSVFLQGLVLADPDTLPPFFAPARAAIRNFQQAARAAGRSAAQAALAFLYNRPETNVVLVGVDSVRQFEDLTSHLPEPVTLDYAAFRVTDERVLDPTGWPA